MSARHKCFIPNFPNSVSKTPDKVFMHVNNHLKRKWCNQLNIVFNPQQRLYCCEDHLNLDEDLDNYYQWKFMKARPRIKSTAHLKYSLENVSSCEYIITTDDKSSDIQIEIRNEVSSELEKLLRSTENIHTIAHNKDKNSTSTTSSSTAAGPVKIDVATQYQTISMIDKSTSTKRVKKHVHKPSIAMDIESISTVSASPSMYGSTLETDVSDSDLGDNLIKRSSRKGIMIDLINENPKMYLGLPKQYLIKEIETLMSINELDILITLLKIKLNDSMTRLSHQLELSRPSVSLSFCRGVTMLASYFQNFVFMPAPAKIKQNLPLVFKIRYSNVQCMHLKLKYKNLMIHNRKPKPGHSISTVIQ